MAIRTTTMEYDCWLTPDIADMIYGDCENMVHQCAYLLQSKTTLTVAAKLKKTESMRWRSDVCPMGMTILGLIFSIPQDL